MIRRPTRRHAVSTHSTIRTHGAEVWGVMHCQLKQAACRLGRCPTYVQDRRMLAGPYPTCTERHMTLLVREPRLATKLARQRERKVHRSPSQPLTGLMLSLTSHLETARCGRTDKTPLG